MQNNRSGAIASVIALTSAITLAVLATGGSAVSNTWYPQPNWSTRVALTAIARTATPPTPTKIPTITPTPRPTQIPWYYPRTQTAVARLTVVAGYTSTPTKTNTPTRTSTPTITETPLPTSTPTITNTPTITSTPPFTTTPPTATQTPPPVPYTKTPFWPVPESSSTPPPLPAPNAVGVVTNGIPYDNEEESYLTNLNAYRASLGLAPVKRHQSLDAAATWMAEEEAQYNYLSHHDRGGRDPGQRMIDFGASPYAWMCEITLGGSVTGWSAFNVFYYSPGHNGCQIDPKYIDVGIARAWGPLDGWRWVIVFSSGADIGMKTPTPIPGLIP